MHCGDVRRILPQRASAHNAGASRADVLPSRPVGVLPYLPTCIVPEARRSSVETSSQRHVDPESGQEEFIFSCYNQDQDLDRVDFANLQARLRQNSVQEKIANLWFEHLLDQAELAHV